MSCALAPLPLTSGVLLDAACPQLARVRAVTAVLELYERAAAGDLAAQAELEALAGLLERTTVTS